MRAGEELLHDKKGVHNSYQSPDSINEIDWSLKAKNKDVFNYYKDLIALRKSHPAFRIATAEGVRGGPSIPRSEPARCRSVYLRGTCERG